MKNQYDPHTKKFICQGEWTLIHLDQLRNALEKTVLPSTGKLIIDGSGITDMDTAGAWLLIQWQKKISKKGLEIDLQNFAEEYLKLLSIMSKKMEIPAKEIPQVESQSWLAKLGQYTIYQLEEFREFLSFTGKITVEAFQVFNRPARGRFASMVGIMDKSGIQALPIIALLSFAIGMVIAYQMAIQLRNYGANIFIVDLMGLSVLREFGPLLTAIMVAGRTGSSFTAQLGIMKINQEIDALNTMGITSEQLLLLPRLAALFIVLPLLTMWADIFGVLGGMIMANNMLGIPWHDFLIRFRQEIPLRALFIGLGKAPVFALIIASVGCFQGMKVHGSAESVGLRTTRSVVLSIFFIIIVDAIFSVLFSEFKL